MQSVGLTQGLGYWKHAIKVAVIQTVITGAFLVVQGLRNHLAMQATLVWSLAPEEPACHGATEPVCHNSWACALEPTNCNYWSPCSQSPCSAIREHTTVRSLRSTTKSSPLVPLEKDCAQQWRHNAVKNTYINKFFLKNHNYKLK